MRVISKCIFKNVIPSGGFCQLIDFWLLIVFLLPYYYRMPLRQECSGFLLLIGADIRDGCGSVVATLMKYRDVSLPLTSFCKHDVTLPLSIQ